MSSGKKFNWPWVAWPVQFVVRKELGENEAGLVPQGSMVRPGHGDHKGLKALKEFRDLPVPKATKVLKDPKGILVIPSQLPLLSHHRFLWWLTKLM